MFKPGDMVVVTNQHPVPMRRGLVTTVSRTLDFPNGFKWFGPTGEITEVIYGPVCELAVEGLGVRPPTASGYAWCPPRYLRPYRESWDRAEEVEAWIRKLATRSERV